MRILGIDSSGLVASVAVLEDDKLVAQFSTNYKKTHSQTLMPLLDGMLEMVDMDIHTIDALAVAKGPGSFTGLRIGAATVKGLGLALGKPVVEVPTMEGLAYNLYGFEGVVCPLMDARRGQVYTGLYRFETKGNVQELVTLLDQDALDIREILKKASAYGEKVAFLGDGVDAYQGIIENEFEGEYLFVSPAQKYQSAASIASLGAIRFAKGEFVKAEDHQPEYLRKSQAEREKEEGRGPSVIHEQDR